MNKEMFLEALEDRLFQLPDEEKKQQVDYYREVLEDKIEDGMSEEEAVASFGDIDTLADDILQDTPLTTLVKTKVKPKKGWTPAAIVLVVVGSPIWVPIAIAVLAVVISIFAVCWAVIVSIFAAVLSIGIGGIYLIVKGFTLAGSGFPYILLTIGSGITMAGLCLFAWLGARILVIWMVQFTKWLAREIKGIFIKKGGPLK